MGMIQLRLIGTQPLLCHNIHLSDPDNDFVKAIAAITGKRKKTEEDRREIEKLEWYGGIYVSPSHVGRPTLPTGNIRKCLIQAAKVQRLGKAVERALQFLDLDVPIQHDGPDDINGLFASDRYHHRASVGIGPKRTMRMRPRFPVWALEARANLLSDVLDLDDFKRIAELAGQIEGLGDNRVNGYGRFKVEVHGA